jgi:Putative zinc-finger
MTECWAEGKLRAYLDRELPAEELERVAFHLAECDECARAVAEMNARASWVGEMMGTLSAAETAPRRARKPWRWIAAAAALAAGIAIGVVVWRQAAVQPVAFTVASDPVKSAAAAPAPETTGLRPVDRIPSGPQVANLPHKRHTRKPAQPDDAFVALDDEPFDTGVVLRMALGPAQVPADVLVGPDGRAHAIRLVNYK